LGTGVGPGIGLGWPGIGVTGRDLFLTFIYLLEQELV
jgi:hypothetical protein